MGAIGGEELMNWEKMEGVGNGREEKILVLVRLRPLNEKEIARNDVSDWECINDTTVLFRNSLQERSMFPTAYSFDRVFSGDATTRQVYDEGAKGIALSVVSGINSSIFAYGQTSSGKTYTMTGITEYTVADIYAYMQKHEERAFVLKFSAIEIYNEAIRDLLSTDNIPLRVLDDPEKGTIIEKLTEETLRDWGHLKQLLSVCEAQRKVGETSLNETSSRSHQILRLTIESSANEFIGKDKSTKLTASVNFVDLAGSERAAQALSVGQRLKEGCHINRSLLTLSTVIRKLSKGKHGHVNYRDSKLTRILQPCLGGNARTAIICTLSPAREHVEQSKNTLLFASCAKEVTTNAQVNVVMSDKALVKHLQKELARLENELRTPAPPDYSALLKKKDQQIEKLEKEVRDLIKQRDLAESRIQELLQAVRNDQVSTQWDGRQGNTCADEYSSESSSTKLPGTTRHQENSNSPSLPSRTLFRTRTEEEESNTVCKEVRCVETDESTNDQTAISNGESESVSGPTETSHLRNRVNIGSLEQNFQDLQNTINSLVTRPYGDGDEEQEVQSQISNPTGHKLTKSRSCRANLVTSSSPPAFENTPPNDFETRHSARPEGRKLWDIPPQEYGGAASGGLLRSDSQSSLGSTMLEDAKNKTSGEEDIPSVDTFVAGLKKMAKLQFDQVNGSGAEGDGLGKSVKSIGIDSMMDSPPADWPQEFARQQKCIVELWQACNVSLIHRTYFFLLFRGDPMDSIYMEVEIRRLSFLKETFSKGNPAFHDGHTLTSASSIKALRREKAMLSRLMNKRFSEEEKKKLYQKWGVNPNSKRRRLQLIHRLWTNTEDPNHLQDSASVVSKLIKFSEQGQALKEMFGLSFSPPKMVRRSLGWKPSMSSLL
ncbi:putative plus-end-directed kinesin ATPase [Helianthus annuus]|uniref:Kinesin-like protein n=1 Tax=Helianthus annuus TaxID=4232 RepID=A0A251UHD7_HELAN|nr:kinesin-like protein KIN-7E [Helianthus annuus]XP_035842422.1 kinesin-like protein KIN-7E [Helianthus annuus]XP_035842423.1 kinesin-like protein KIN-7E [Helianthus annuus]XP_035842424.1 kinesin-like protein KIN-7E [Helianthus annuus]KAF5755825.1 putative plus-end-directed kinesin ATPase [Helianthus annuus]KAJ0429459.1 putative plus-end-directed kinesin ATPase [Helianthus annuus]KAJ0636590.1 putative plus-end-directed kinesin ATPase [Helianthus annuus]KAJ0803921.1 putative plus-end-directe